MGEDGAGASAVDGGAGSGGAGTGGTGTGDSGGLMSDPAAVEMPHVGRTVTLTVGQLRSGSESSPMIQCINAGAADAVGIIGFRIWAGESCGCDGLHGNEPTEGARRAIDEYLVNYGYCAPGQCGNLCACQEAPVQEASSEACLSDLTDPPEPAGWCFASGEEAPELAAFCAPPRTSVLRVFGHRSPDEVFLFFVSSELTTELVRPSLRRPVGATCIPEHEWNPGYPGASMTDVLVNTNDAACDSSICLTHNFQGRVSCPFGQRPEEVEAGEFGCFLPGSEEPVQVTVEPSRLARPPGTSAVCSCRCDGTGPGPFCQCPAGMECAPFIDEVGIPNVDELEGSYCIPSETAFNPQAVIPADTCLSARDHQPTPSIDDDFCDDPPPY